MCLHSHKMQIFVVGCVFIVYFLHVLLAQKGCSFPAHGANEKLSPIMMYNDTSLVLPTNGTIILKANEVLTLLCPDSKNFLIQSNSNTTKARCIQRDVLRVANQDFAFDKLQCSRIIRGTVSTTTKKCGNNQGFIYKIGYQVSSKMFVKLIEICYDGLLGATLYSEHLLHGQEIKHASRSNYRPGFSTDSATVSVGVAYKQVYQKSTFNKLLKSATYAEKYINKGSFLARGHLSPDADFLFAATQFSTYYYINVFPQWQAINSANWKKVEFMVRTAAHKLQETLTIVTGTYDVLTLPDDRNKEVEIFLVSGDRLPVPKFVWKIVYSKKSRKAIVLIALNNPFVDSIKERDVICKNVCNATGWNLISWDNYKSGFVYCCTYRDFVSVVKTAPNLLVEGTLQKPK